MKQDLNRKSSTPGGFETTLDDGALLQFYLATCKKEKAHLSHSTVKTSVSSKSITRNCEIYKSRDPFMTRTDNPFHYEDTSRYVKEYTINMLKLGRRPSQQPMISLSGQTHPPTCLEMRKAWLHSEHFYEPSMPKKTSNSYFIARN
jgi:hypothetical protein